MLLFRCWSSFASHHEEDWDQTEEERAELGSAVGLLFLQTHAAAHFMISLSFCSIQDCIPRMVTKRRERQNIGGSWRLCKVYIWDSGHIPLTTPYKENCTEATELGNPRRSSFCSAFQRALLKITDKLPPCWWQLMKVKKISYIVLPEKATSLSLVFKDFDCWLSWCHAPW